MIGNCFGNRQTPISPAATTYFADRLMPRIKHAHFLAALQNHGVPPEQMPLTRALCGDLLVSYAFDTPEQWVTVTPPLLEGTGIAPEEVLGLAVQTLHRQVLEHGVRLLEDRGAYVLRIGPAETATHLEATCVLLDGIWDLLRDEIKPQGELLVCAPTRDYLFALDGAKPETHAHALDLARELMGKDEVHGLSLQWMAHGPAGLTARPAP